MCLFKYLPVERSFDLHPALMFPEICRKDFEFPHNIRFQKLHLEPIFLRQNSDTIHCKTLKMSRSTINLFIQEILH